MSMAGLWCCGNCLIPMDYKDTEMTRCPMCGMQMDWFRAEPYVPTGIERMAKEGKDGL